MNEQLVTNFVKQAMSVGLPKQKIAELLKKAEEISMRGTAKQADDNLDRVVGTLLSNANLDKTASSVAYTTGILKQAVDAGYTVPQSIEIAKQALAKTNENLVTISKLASIMQNEKLASYAEGFIKAAVQSGVSQEDATHMLINLVDREKQATGDGSELFKQPAAPAGDPGLGASPGDPKGGDPSQGGQQGLTLPNGQPIPPELLAQILAMISGGQGGAQPGGPQGMPPQGMPQGSPAGMPPGPGHAPAGLAQ